MTRKERKGFLISELNSLEVNVKLSGMAEPELVAMVKKVEEMKRIVRWI